MTWPSEDFEEPRSPVAEVREFVRLVTGEYGMDDFVPWLVASELVTNALQHATSATDE